MPKSAKKKTTPKIEELHGNLLYCREDASSLGFDVEAHLINSAIAGVEERMPSQLVEERSRADAA